MSDSTQSLEGAIDALVHQAVAAQTAAQTAPPVAAPLSAATALDVWLDGHVRNTGYARDTQAWNRIVNATAEIKAALAAVDATQGGQ